MQGVRYRNETLNGALDFASMAGGMQIFIDGAGFDDMVEMNTIFFDSVQDETLRLIGPPYSRKRLKITLNFNMPKRNLNQIFFI